MPHANRRPSIQRKELRAAKLLPRQARELPSKLFDEALEAVLQNSLRLLHLPTNPSGVLARENSPQIVHLQANENLQMKPSSQEQDVRAQVEVHPMA